MIRNQMRLRHQARLHERICYGKPTSLSNAASGLESQVDLYRGKTLARILIVVGAHPERLNEIKIIVGLVLSNLSKWLVAASTVHKNCRGNHANQHH